MTCHAPSGSRSASASALPSVFRSAFLAGVARTLATVGLFVGGGVAAAALAGAPLRPPAAAAPPHGGYPLRAMQDAGGPTGAESGPAGNEGTGRVWLVDGFNALHVGVLRGRERGEWWRREGRRLLLDRVRGLARGAPGDELWVVFDGPRPADEGSGTAGAPGPRVVFARSADAWLLRRVREAAEPERLTVVTADKRLADRARRRGARVEAPSAFLERCAT